MVRLILKRQSAKQLLFCSSKLRFLLTFRKIKRQLLKNPGGDRVMAQVLSAVPLHGVEAVLVAVELALQAGRVSGEHVLNTLSRLKEPCTMVAAVQTPLTLQVPPQANTSRYDGLRDAEVMA